MEKKDIIEDLVNLAIESHNLVLEGTFSAKISDDIADHLRKCLAIIDHCTVKPTEEELASDSFIPNYTKTKGRCKDVE